MSAETNTSERRDWDWGSDGELVGLYVETRAVTVKNGPSAGKERLIFDFHVGADDQLVSVWESTVLKSKLRKELHKRHKTDFEPGERMAITPLGTKEGANGPYRDFAVEFEHAAPKLTTADLLSVVDVDELEPDGAASDDIQFG